MPEQPVRGLLFEFAFRSRLVDMSASDVARLVRSFWLGNRRSAITGEMNVSGFAIEQVIEGEPASVLAIAARILADPRHADIVVTAFGPVGTRRFDDWRVHGVEFGQVQKVDFCNRVVALRRDSDLSPRRRSA